MTQQMPQITECSAAGCAYNQEGNCCTMAINVGGPDPMCDTYLPSANKGGMKGVIAGVGACKVSSCVHNKGLMCGADSVKVQLQGEQVLCVTFKAS